MSGSGYNKPMKKICLLLILAVIVLCACAPVNVEETIRKPAEKNESVVHVVPMIPSAVKALIAESEVQKQHGETTNAIELLHRARTITPGSPVIQQHLAETYLAVGNYFQALYWGELAEKNGPGKGSLCERSRRTIAVAAGNLALTQQQEQALNSIASCIEPIKKRY